MIFGWGIHSSNQSWFFLSIHSVSQSLTHVFIYLPCYCQHSHMHWSFEFISLCHFKICWLMVQTHTYSPTALKLIILSFYLSTHVSVGSFLWCIHVSITLCICLSISVFICPSNCLVVWNICTSKNAKLMAVCRIFKYYHLYILSQLHVPIPSFKAASSTHKFLSWTPSEQFRGRITVIGPNSGQRGDGGHKAFANHTCLQSSQCKLPFCHEKCFSSYNIPMYGSTNHLVQVLYCVTHASINWAHSLLKQDPRHNHDQTWETATQDGPWHEESVI